MNEDLEQINQRLLSILGDLQQWAVWKMNAKCRDTIDPMVRNILRSAGIDLSQLQKLAQSQMPDPYTVLGLDKSASDDEVKKRYHELIHILHPDKSGTKGTKSLFQAVKTAYELIKRERGRQQ